MPPATVTGSYPLQSVFFLLYLPGDSFFFFFSRRLPTASASWGLTVPMCARSAGRKSHQKLQVNADSLLKACAATLRKTLRCTPNSSSELQKIAITPNFSYMHTGTLLSQPLRDIFSTESFLFLSLVVRKENCHLRVINLLMSIKKLKLSVQIFAKTDVL